MLFLKREGLSQIKIRPILYNNGQAEGMSNKNTYNNITFSGWFHWNVRLTNHDTRRSGVYAIAGFQRVPRQMDRLSPKIIYFGETTSRNKSISSRLNNFKLSAETYKKGHSGGRKYWRLYHEDQEVIPFKDSDIYFSFALPMNAEDILQPLEIKMMERICLYEFAIKNGRLPKCNSS